MPAYVFLDCKVVNWHYKEVLQSRPFRGTCIFIIASRLYAPSKLQHSRPQIVPPQGTSMFTVACLSLLLACMLPQNCSIPGLRLCLLKAPACFLLPVYHCFSLVCSLKTAAFQTSDCASSRHQHVYCCLSICVVFQGA